MKTCIVCQIKNERLYVKEWVDYHLNLGFDHIFLYEDYGSESHADLLEDYSNVDVIPMKDTGIENYYSTITQKVLYKSKLKELINNKEYDWVAFIDVDEFIVFEEGYNIEKLCEEFKDYAGVWMAWKMFDANNHIKRPEGKVMDNYTHVLEDRNNFHQVDCNQWNKKSFVNLHKADSFNNIHIINGGIDTNYNNNQHAPVVYSKVWINHYFSKSWEDYCYRMQTKGNMGNFWRDYDLFFKQNPSLVPQMRKLINSIRYIHIDRTMYISKKLGIINGGNIDTIKKISSGDIKKLYLIDIS